MMEQAVREYLAPPAHIDVCAGMVRYDLLHGPAWCRVPAAGIEQITADDLATFPADLEDDLQPGDTLTEVYTGAPATTLRAWIDDLPSLYYDPDCDHVSACEPEGWTDEETGEYFEPEPVYTLDRDAIVAALFGRVLAREFR